MTQDQKIYTEIGKLLGTLMPLQASEISFYGKVENKSQSSMIEFVYRDSGETGWFSMDDDTDDIEDQIMEHMICLEKLVPYKEDPFTQFKICLKDSGKFKVEYAYIDEDDSWPELYLKGVSELSEDQLSLYHIPKEHWLERVKTAKRS